MSRVVEEPRNAGGCDCGASSVRNRYFRGKQLTVYDYQVEQRYHILRRRLVNRSVLGWGVVSGFRAMLRDKMLVVEPGVALDCQGRELVLCEPFCVAAPEDVLWLQPGKCGLEVNNAPPADGSYLLSAHYAERRVDGVRVKDDCGNVACEANHICETVVFSLRPETGCRPFKAVDCDCAPHEGDQPAETPSGRPKVAPKGVRGVGNLCRVGRERLDNDGEGDERLPSRSHGACCCHYDPCKRSLLSAFGCLDVDVNSGLPLLYVKISVEDCKLTFADPTEIVRCCDYTAIRNIGWRAWHEQPGIEIERSAFAAMFVKPPENEADIEKPVDTAFWVCFTGPVQRASVTPDVVTMSLIQPDLREAVGTYVRVPIVGLWHAPQVSGDPPGTTRGFRLFVQRSFWVGEINRGARTGFSQPTRVEIRINASAIVDWNGQALDGYSVGRSLPSGNGSPGGDFVSSFHVRGDADNR